MIAQHRMIRSARRSRIGSSLRVLLSSFSFELVRDNQSDNLSNSISRENPRCVPTIARPNIRLKLKTLIEREREEEGVKKKEIRGRKNKSGRKKKQK